MVKNNKYLGLPLETVIEVVSIKGDKVYKKEMTLGEAQKINKKRGYTYRFYKLGYSAYKNVINLK